MKNSFVYFHIYRVCRIKTTSLIWLKMAFKSVVNKKTWAYSHHKDSPFDMKHQLMSADPFPVVKLTLSKRVGF